MVDLLAAESSNDLIKVVPGLMIWTLIAFAITFFVLRKFAFGPIQKTIDDRRDRIRQAVEEADNARNEARELLEQNRAILGQARSESADILAEARKVADAQIERAKQEAEAERQRRLEDTRKQIEAETVRAIGQIRERGGRPHDRGDRARRRQGARRRGPAAARRGGRPGPRLLGPGGLEELMAVAHRMYARALFEAAREQDRVDVGARRSSRELADALEATPELEAFLANPQLDPGAKAGVLDEVTDGRRPDRPELRPARRLEGPRRPAARDRRGVRGDRRPRAGPR